MPEGVEVRISAELIKPLVKDRQVVQIFTHHASRYADPNSIQGFSEFKQVWNDLSQPVFIRNVRTRGKLMWWDFDHQWHMLCTFGMSGQWSQKQGVHACLIIRHGASQITDNQFIHFNDPRHFGTIKFVQGDKELRDKLNTIGWDPFQDDLSQWSKFLTKSIQKSNKSIGTILLDQSLFGGVGNYIRADALYLAKISPWKLGKQLSAADIERLCLSVKQVMEESYAHQGATIHTYADPYGNEGHYSSSFKVYGLKQDALGNPVIKETTPEGRTIHWCPAVQQ